MVMSESRPGYRIAQAILVGCPWRDKEGKHGLGQPCLGAEQELLEAEGFCVQSRPDSFRVLIDAKSARLPER